MAASCPGATSRRASAPPLVTPLARGLPLAGAQPGSPAELRAAAAPPPAAPSRSAPQKGLPTRVPGRKAGGLVTCPRRSRNSSGGEESFPNIRGIKKSPPQLSSSSNRLSKNISSTTGKAVHPALDDDQPCDVFKKGSRVNDSHQKIRSMDAGPSWNKAPRSKKSSGKRQSKSQVPHVPSQPQNSLGGISPPAGDELGGSVSPEGEAGRSPLGSRCQGASGKKLLLDFKSMRIMKGDADEDSASDLSDSERVPIPPSPRTPPDLRLRAEEIDPVCFDLDLQPAQGHARPEHCYPDLLPPPCNSWDLRDMAVLVHTEHRPGAVPRAGGLLGKYVHRLVQLEWLQILTIQGERGEGARARPPTAPRAAGPPQSPGRRKPTASAASRPHQHSAPKAGPSRRKGFPREEGHPSCYSFETSAKPLEVLSASRLCSQKQTLDLRAEEKKKKSSKSPRLPRWDLAGLDSSRRIESNGNIRIPKQSAVMLDSADAHKASKTQAHANLKKKGNANNCAHASLSSEKKLRTNGGKPNTHKFK